MESPSVHYARTPDGVDIAYTLGGAGPPVVVLPFHHNHVVQRWSGPPWVSGLAPDHRVLHYDSRGQGLSKRGLADTPCIDDYLSDLETVIEAGGFERFVLVAYGGFAHVAMRYADANADRVRALVLICTSESHSAWPQVFFLTLAEENWDLFLQLELRADYSEALKTRIVEFAKGCASQADYVKMVRCFAGSSVTDILPRLHLPTLLLHSSDQHWLSPEEGTKLAAKIVGSRIVFLDGDLEPDAVQGVRAMLSFMEELQADSPLAVPAAPGAPLANLLSSRQIEVLGLIAVGKTTREMAEELVLSERTVERHIADVYTRLGVRNRAEATALSFGRLNLE